MSPTGSCGCSLQEAGREYDINRGFPPFRSMNKELLNRFDHACAYCGDADASPVDEHVVPMNRASVGLHAWGNIVPACRPCNNAKKDDPWYGHPMLDEPRREAISAYITEYRYEPTWTS